MRKNKLLKKVVAMVSAVAMAVTMVPFVGGTQEVKAATYSHNFKDGTYTGSFYTFFDDDCTIVNSSKTVAGVSYTKGYKVAGSPRKFMEFTTASAGQLVIHDNSASLNYYKNGVAQSQAKHDNNVVTINCDANTKYEIATAGPDKIIYSVTFTEKQAHSISILDGIVNGSIVSDSSSSLSGKAITLTATPDEGYTIDAWDVRDSDNNPITVSIINSKKATFNMPDSEVTVSATFKVGTVAEYNVSVSSADVAKGSISVDKLTAEAGETVKVTTTAKAPYILSGYNVTGVSIDKKATVTFVMPANDVSITANFEKYGNYSNGTWTFPLDSSLSGNITANQNDEFNGGIKVVSAAGDNNANVSYGKEGLKITNGYSISIPVTSVNGTLTMKYPSSSSGRKLVTKAGNEISSADTMTYNYKAADVENGYLKLTASGGDIKLTEIKLTDKDTVDSSATPKLQFKQQANGDYSVRIVYEIQKSLVEGKSGSVGIKCGGTDLAPEILAGYNIYEKLMANGEEVTPAAGNAFVIVEITNVPKSAAAFTVTPYATVDGATDNILVGASSVEVNMANIVK